ncbi:MAG: glycosyltransferase family 2 protein [Candidatus Gracilibacteria bacterium]|nr:glycosyltransferase family 2 protein [Candidatus Gracilibacteria bacterium]
MNKKLASILISTTGKAASVVESVKRLQKQIANFDIEIIVSDNSCREDQKKILEELKEIPNVKLIFIDHNNGYIRNYHELVNASKGEYLFIVNPDIQIKHEDTLQKLVDYLEKNPEIGILGPKQINEPGGEVAMTVRAFPNIFLQVARRTGLRNLPILKKLVAHDEMRHLDYNKTQEVDWLQSSFILLTRNWWETLGGFDKTYFIFMSDPEICFQTWKHGKKVVFYPEVIVYADGKRLSQGGFKDFFKKWLMRQHLKDSLKYTFKHLFERNPRKK